MCVVFGQACSSIYFMLESLHQIHFLYQFSLQFFLDVFSCVLTPATNPALNGRTDPAERLSIITQALFSVSVTPSEAALTAPVSCRWSVPPVGGGGGAPPGRVLCCCRVT